MDEGVERVHRLLRSLSAGSLPAQRAGKRALTEKLQDHEGLAGRQSYLSLFQEPLQRSNWLLSFFDDGEETAPRPAARAPRTPQRPRPRRAQPSDGDGSLPLDQHTLMVRRRLAAGVGVVLLIVIVLIVNGCLKSQKKQALESYNRNVSRIAQESDQQVSQPFFAALVRRQLQVRARRRGPARPAAPPGSRARRPARRA